MEPSAQVKLKEKVFRGTIKDAFKSNTMIYGNVYGHGFFPDGAFIHTSRVIEVVNNRAETLNSFYDIEWAQEPNNDV